jgi:tRNA A-37 threonylcarbamoyl transferase component Bud32
VVSTELLDTIEARLATSGVGTTTSARATLRATKTVASIVPRGAESGLELETTLGEGGMGVVALATQRSLGRKVAVKTVRHQSADDAQRLIREGMLTGSLEHPNIVPVHDLVTTTDGLPQLVLKRIEGTTWLDRMNDEEAVERLFGAGDLLEWNLETLAQVCQAVHFAHSRGVVHRDLKPENVMVGNFGEVYVVDWGIATSVGARQAVDSEEGIVGTPAYMAPEMLLGGVVDARTDVYLLGAILYEILSGKPPHLHADVRRVVTSALEGPPPMPVVAPEELASLARACMSVDPAERPQTAEAVRRGLVAFLRHRDSAALAGHAEAKVRDLEQALGSRDSLTAPNDPVRNRAPTLYGECVFAFRAALEAWPDNPTAKTGLARAVRAMIDHDLARGMARTAEMHLADLPEPDEALAARVAEAISRARADERKVAALRELGTELDPATGRRLRMQIAALLLAVFVVTAVLDEVFIIGTPRETHGYFVLEALVHAVVCAGVMRAYWPYLRRSRVNRQLAASVVFAVLTQVPAHAGASLAGLSVADTRTALLFLWSAFLGMVSIAIVRAMWPSALAMLAGFFVCVVHREAYSTASTITNVFLLVNAVLAWRARDDADGSTGKG